MEPGSVVGAVGASVNALYKFWVLGLHYKEVPEEVKQFGHNIELMDEKINTSKRLRRTKSHLLDTQTKNEVDRDIKRSEEVLGNISNTIEACRADLETKGKIRVKNRLWWLMRDHQAFMSKGMTLGNCLQTLSCDIMRMSAVQQPLPSPPTYNEVIGETLLRGPTQRRKQARTAFDGETLVDEERPRSSLGFSQPSDLTDDTYGFSDKEVYLPTPHFAYEITQQAQPQLNRTQSELPPFPPSESLRESVSFQDLSRANSTPGRNTVIWEDEFDDEPPSEILTPIRSYQRARGRRRSALMG